jgi:2-polyprenyl-3-methyl-5-hydroxy-6-metoxy-1,4-benzoquinol methylase
MSEAGWRCPVCGGSRGVARWRVSSEATENGVAADVFRPSADRYGETVGKVLRCLDCGHGSLAETPTDEALAAAYEDAEDPVSIDEEPGQVETARRSLARIESVVGVGRLVDIGCWTGSFVAAAAERGWSAVGVEPSAWAVKRAAERGLDVRLGDLQHHDLDDGSFDCVVMGDVIEHVLDVREAIRACVRLLAPGGALYLTTPDAGARLARALGARWWSVLPMHVQYFTRASMQRLLEDEGLRVVTMDTHPKVFTAAYYAERLGGYSPALARFSVGTTRTLGFADRLVAPDFRDRMQVLAVRR